MKAAQIRQAFLDYFASKGHEIVPSSSLVPGNDPTLLFTNAGMVQFKDLFLGREKRAYQRATSSQRCVRAGGKHNDLENVGYTARHHTFFEMLGNFSFGDYFKHDAIAYAWEFLTEVLKLPPERLWITVFDEDKEAETIWLNDIGVDPNRFSRIGAKDNFWSMGDTGPCGPCTEIFYDHGPEVAGGPPGTPEEDGDRYVEIWNLVFMQYDRSADGTLTPLPKPSVDTGAGLERVAAVMQKVRSNYEIDLFQALIKAAAAATKCGDLTHNSLKVIADHIRSCVFLIIDGVVPSNEGRGYVLRRIIRRALRHGYELGQKDLFFHKLVKTLAEQMGDAYPELIQSQAQVEKILRREEERFAETLEQGMGILEGAIASLSGKQIPGETVFRLYDTYGFPVDLTEDIARNRGLTIDHAGFEKAMEGQRDRARAASQFKADYSADLDIEGKTEFTGYENLVDKVTIEAIFVEGKPVTHLSTGEQGIVVLNKTPFYAESGGQVGDTGMLRGKGVEVEISDTQKQAGGVFVHFAVVEQGELKEGAQLSAEVDEEDRKRIACNHSATHLLHAALRQVLGEHVQQKGSLVEANRLRFDFSHPEPVSNEQLIDIENLVNKHIRGNHTVETKLMQIEAAKASGAMALFGEKYDDEVRVLRMSDFSVELCGGTHVTRTGDIGLLKILNEGGVAAGVRRIEAIAGEGALQSVQQGDAVLSQLASLLKTSKDQVQDKLHQLFERNRLLEKELDQLKSKMASAAGSDLSGSAKEIKGIKVVAARLDGADAKSLRDTVDQLKNKLGKAAVVLATVEDGKVRLIAGVTKESTDKIKAGELVNMVAQQVGGKGGGRPDMAQAGGTDPTNLDAALQSVEGWVSDKLG
ncbi:MAG: alanine--tRNA ligase [Gammaproteobacteria bacterium]|nr:alanine--tRNA ligase [Gammaproteobacteria bacterium]